MSGGRVWFAFEVRPGITRRGPTASDWGKPLAEECRQPNGKIDREEYAKWMEILVEYCHQWGRA